AGTACPRAGRRRGARGRTSRKRTARIVSSPSTLTVPFRSPLEAEIARGSLAPDAEPHGGVVHKEFTLNGSVLAVRWTAEDPRLLRISIINFLDQLSLVVRTMQRFGPPVFR
ncbi:EKC/KEOPS complex subunit LAGE3, partial [Trichechus manatus latirostris]|uniref:L antigen family member 3 n=1 Tax=Trichechus manatus latirostris TaxID=127582 RepID=A0A2Y9QPR6_TRIMA